MAREIEIHLKETSQEISRMIMKKIAYQANKALGKMVNTGRSALKQFIYQAVLDSPEMRSLSGGKLQAQFGLRPGQASQVPIEIASAVADSIQLIRRPVAFRAQGLRGGLSISIQPTDYKNLLGVDGSTTTYFSKYYKKMVTLDWLDWLVRRGDEIIVAGFHVEYGNHGRSGKAKMKKSTGSSWKVDSAYSGTVSDNFISRSLNDPSVRNSMLKVLNKMMNDYFSGK